MKSFLLVGLGGGFGSILRYAVSMLNPGRSLPWGTLLVNVTGSFIIGVIIALALKPEGGLNNNWRLFLATGICGGYTTFSAFSLENVQLMQSGKPMLSLIYICGSILLAIAATWIGMKLVNQ